MLNSGHTIVENLRTAAYRAADLLCGFAYWSVLIDGSSKLTTSVRRGVADAPEREILKAVLSTLGSGNNVSYASEVGVLVGPLSPVCMDSSVYQ
jgi:hypothetical protein